MKEKWKFESDFNYYLGSHDFPSTWINYCNFTSDIAELKYDH